MGRIRHIMLIDPHPETRQNAIFLLRLARHRITPLTDLSEAVNWLSNRSNRQESFDLALFNNPLSGPLPADLLHTLQTFHPGLPLLWVQRGSSPPHPPAGITVQHCRPENILETIQTM